MTGYLLTLFLCLITASSRVLLKKGMRDSNPLTGMTYSLLIGVLFLGIYAVPRMISQWQDLQLKGLLIFIGIGFIAPPVVRYLTYVGIDKIGASRSDPLRSVQPLFALVFSGFFLKEQVSILIWIAACMILAGAFLISRQNNSVHEKKYSKFDLLYPLLAALIAGVITNYRKYGMSFLPDPIIAAFVAAFSALIVFSTFLLITGKYKQIVLTKDSKKFFLISGGLTAFTDILDLWALQLSQVQIVAPLLGATPLFVVLLSSLFLKKEESIGLKTWLGAGLIFVAIQLILYQVTRSV